MIEFVTETSGTPSGAVIRAIGIGGGGCNAIDSLKKDGVMGVDFIAANSDVQALQKNTAEIKVQVGKNTAKGLGVGGNPEVGKKCVDESLEDIKKHLVGSDMVFISAGMGGGTGTGGAPSIAKIAKELGALVVAIVTKPFKFEGTKKHEFAEKGIEDLRKCVDSIIVVSNQKLFDEFDKKMPFTQATRKVDEVLINASKGIVDIIHNPGFINIDFADIKNVMLDSGDALIGIGKGKGENRAAVATQNALNSPLLDGVTIAGAKGVLINITADQNFSMDEIETVTDLINQASGVDPYLKCGVVITEEPTEEFTVTVLATKFEKVSNEMPVQIIEEVVEIETAPVNVQAQNKGYDKQPKKVYPVENTPIYPQSNPGRGGRGGFNPQPVQNPPFIVNDLDYRPAASHPTNTIPGGVRTAPKGNIELQSLETPAYDRREPARPLEMAAYDRREQTQVFASTGTYGVDTHTKVNTSPQEEPARRVQERPVFLRRLMD